MSNVASNPNEVPMTEVIDRLSRRIAQLEVDKTVLQIALEQATAPGEEASQPEQAPAE